MLINLPIVSLAEGCSAYATVVASTSTISGAIASRVTARMVIGGAASRGPNRAPKILAVKEFRIATGAGLRQSKEAVEAIAADLSE